MLRIERSHTGEAFEGLKLEGQVIGPWVEEVRRLSEEILASGAALSLDLSAVAFIDRGGIELLRALKERRGVVLKSSGFAAEQLKSSER